jgi:sugar lactone lactonase YvrE
MVVHCNHLSHMSIIYVRINLTTDQRKTLASQRYIKPQGLALDPHGNIFVADDYANSIMEYNTSISRWVDVTGATRIDTNGSTYHYGT